MIIIPSPRHPFVIYLLAGLLLAGISGLLDPIRASPAVAHLLPFWELWIWYGGLTATSSIALLGVFSRGVGGLLTERIGLCVLGVLILTYVTSVIVAGGFGNVAALVTAALALACFARVWQITSTLRRIARLPVTAPPEEPP